MSLRTDDHGEWRAIPGIESAEVSSLGFFQVYDTIHGWRPPFKPYQHDDTGCCEMSIAGKRHSAARLVCLAFHGPPPSPKHVAMHMASYGDDHVRERGDNRACNLRWATLAEAFSHRPRPKKNRRLQDEEQSDLPGEQWKRVDDRMRVSDMGRAQVKYSHGDVWAPIFTPLPSRTGRAAIIRGSELFHRVVLKTFVGSPPEEGMTGDHINRNPSDNRLCNLRWATKSLQSANTSRKRKSTSLSKAVEGYCASTNTWIQFESCSDAACALELETGKVSQSAGVSLAARRDGTYHGRRFRMIG